MAGLLYRAFSCCHIKNRCIPSYPSIVFVDLAFLMTHLTGVFVNQTIPFIKDIKRNMPNGLVELPGICEYLKPFRSFSFGESIFAIY